MLTDPTLSGTGGDSTIRVAITTKNEYLVILFAAAPTLLTWMGVWEGGSSQVAFRVRRDEGTATPTGQR